MTESLIRLESRTYSFGGVPPKLSIILACTWDQKVQVHLLGRYLICLDYPHAELVSAVMDEMHEPSGKNAAARYASTDTLIFTNAGVYPPYSLIERTRLEIERNPNAFCYALRYDGLKDLGVPGVFPNPFAVGDWQAMSRTTFERLGGYNETFEQAGYIDTDMLSRAVTAGCDLIMMDERVFHCWHPEQFDIEDYTAKSERNKARMKEQATPLYSVAWPGNYSELDAPFIISPGHQDDSVVPVHLHVPRAGEGYWRVVMGEKAKRCFPAFTPPVDYQVTVKTDWPVATDSYDHIHPMGAAQDGSANIDFVAEMVHLLKRKRALRVMDLGCAGGSMIADFIKHGHTGVGLDGSDFAKSHKSFAWKDYADTALFTCDITRPFAVRLDGDAATFDLITMWDVFEHIEEDRIEQVIENVAEHMDAHSIFLATIADTPSPNEGVDLHRTQKPIDWWGAKLARWFDRVDYQVQHPIRLNEPATLWRLRRDG